MRRTGLLAALLVLSTLGCHGKYIRPVSQDQIAPGPNGRARGTCLVEDPALGKVDAIVAYLETLTATKNRVPVRELVEPMRSALGG